MNFPQSVIEKNALDVKNLQGDFIDISTGCDCPIEEADPATVMQNNFPLVNWLLGTTLSQQARQRFNLKYVSPTEDGKFEYQIPGEWWTTPPVSTGEECCWIPLEFDKCCGNTVPMNLLCLKDCESVFERLVHRDLKVTRENAMKGIASTGESVETVEKRIARLSMAFYTAHTAIMGLDDEYVGYLKPFHSLFQVMENPAIPTMEAYDILGIFAELACRLDILGDYANSIIAVHPLIYNALDTAVTRGQDGNYPTGWSKPNGALSFKGIRFLQDKMVPVDLEAGTGEAWLLNGKAVGLFLATNLMVGNDFIIDGAIDTSENSCGAECTYYFNYGAAFGTNASKLAKIIDIPINSACQNVIGDLTGLIQPDTLIPRIA